MNRNLLVARGLVGAITVVCALLLGVGSAVANQSPPDCQANNLNLNISREKSFVVSGETNTYTVTATNNVGQSDGCDIANARIAFFCPDVAGNPTVGPTVLAVSQDLAANPPTGTIVQYAPVQCVITTNPGVTSITVRATAGDSVNPSPTDLTLGRLHDTIGDNPFLIDKLLGTEVQTCEVEVDKQVSCDGGLTWFDDNGFQTANGDGTNSPCAGWNEYTDQAGVFHPAEEVLVRYNVNNAGTSALFECDLGESNALIGPGATGISLLSGESTGFIDDSAACSEAVEAGEPDRATVSCFCTSTLDPNIKADAFDDADFECQTPGLSVTKVCDEADAAGDAAVSIVVTNIGTAELVDCQVNDSLYRDDPTCPPVGQGEAQLVVPDFFGLGVGGVQNVDGTVNTFDPACNQVSVTCTIAGTDKTITAEAEDVCEVPACEVEVNKEVSCDGGLTWLDANGLVSANEDGTNNPCAGWNAYTDQAGVSYDAEDMLVRYQAQNTGGSNVYSCDIGDSNPGLAGAPVVGDLVPGETTNFFDDSAACSDNLAAGEPDTATLSCFCSPQLDQNDTAQATDSADFECQTPGLQVTKVCDQADGAGDAAVSIVVTNSGTADLVDCQVNDSLYRDDPTCPPVGPGEAQLVVPDFFGLGAGGVQNVNGTVNTFDPACNQVSVTCTIAGTDKTITAEAEDVCEVPACEVAVNKEVSCDGGLTWLDANGLVSANEDGTNNPCAGWNAYTDQAGVSYDAEDMLVRYQAQNTGGSNVYSCDIGDSNPGLAGAPVVGDLVPGETTNFFDDSAACSDNLAAGEPDTATLSCFCSPQLDQNDTAQATDSADFECQTPGLQVTKVCDQADAAGDAAVSIVVTNSGTAELVDCQVNDSLYRDDPTCPPVGQGEAQLVVPDFFGLGAGGVQNVNGTVNTFDPACNQVSVTCTIAGTDKTITAEAEDVCEVPACEVAVNKEVSCDGGLTWLDANGLVSANEDGTNNPCAGWNAYTDQAGVSHDAEDILVRYQAQNTGGSNVYSCDIGDSNPGLAGAPVVGDLVPGQTTNYFDDSAACSDNLAAGEPDTATLSCFCSPRLDQNDTAQATDSADFECQTPGLQVTKVCDQADAAGDAAVSIVVTNSGTAPLIDCQVNDSLYRDDPTCPPVGQGEAQLVAPDFFGLGVGGVQNVDGTVNTFDPACNQVSVTCTIEGTDKTITAEAEDVCEVPACEVEVNKEVSCDGGLTWLDANGLVSANEDGTNNPCAGWNAYTDQAGVSYDAEDMLVRYQAQNTGGSNVYSCDIGDSNPGLAGAPVVGDLVPGQTSNFFDDSAACSDDLAAGEPDTATLSCFCSPRLETDDKASATDSADFECQTPGLQVTKVCDEADAAGDAAVSIVVTNSGTAELVDCQVNDSLYRDDPTCPPVGQGDPQVVSPDAFGLTAGGVQNVDGTVNTFDPACNQVSVTCTIAGTDKTITAEAEDVCEVPACEVEVNKEVSCDGGLTWLDANGLVSANEDGTNNPCAGWNAYTDQAGVSHDAEDMLVRYQAQNTGGSNVYSCDIGDSNPGLAGAPVVGDLVPGQTTNYFDDSAACSDNLAAGEPDTATLSCFCSPRLDQNDTAQATDSADFECQTPGLQVTKVCDQADAAGDAAVSIVVTNSGTAPLIDCQVNDSLYRDDPTCPPVGQGDPQVVSPDAFGLGAGAVQNVDGTVNTFDPACNQVSVTCTIAGTDKTITAEAEDVCEVPACEVEVNKEVSCDGGLTWLDANGLVSANEDGTNNPCAGWNAYTDQAGVSHDAEDILVRYQAQNTGGSNVYSCDIGDSNPGLAGAPVVGDLVPGETTNFFDDSAACSDDLAAGEPDTATLNCFCSPRLETDDKASATDSADFECQTPGLQVTKVCDEADAAGDAAVSIVVTNSGTANLVDCQVNDSLYRDDPTCPPVGQGDPQVVSPDAFGLTAGGVQNVDGTVNTFDPACNQVSVTCTIEGTDKTITAEAEDVCEVPACEVEVNKEVSCDGGLTWLDANGLVSANEDGTNNPCAGWNAYTDQAGVSHDAEDILVRYQAENTGGSNVYSCDIGDSNPGLAGAPVVGDLVPGETTNFFDDSATCSDDLAAGEPDTATLNCFCSPRLDQNDTAQATDEADFECQTPGLQITKVCDEADASGDAAVSIVVTNNGTAGLIDCQVSDNLYRDDETCPPSGAGEPQTVTPDFFSLGAGADQNVDGTVNTFDPACNQVSVTCTIEGTDKTITAEAEDVCEVPACTIQVDKQVSCDGGLTWHDDNGFVTSNEDGTDPPCAGWNAYTDSSGVSHDAEEVMVRYQATNTGGSNVYSCSIADSNPGLNGLPAGGDLAPGASTVVAQDNPACSDQLAAGEPDTALASCFCSPDLDDNDKAEASDSADFECQTPGLELTKFCADADDQGINDVDITVTNTGTADLIDCQVTDTIYRNDSSCPPSGVGEPVGPLVPDVFDLNAGEPPVEVDGGTSVTADACNTASVTCTIAGTDKTITATGSDICVPPPCMVQVDKQISCDGGLTWHDEGLVSANNDGNNVPCIGWNAFTLQDGTEIPAEEILVRYQARNDSLITVYNCGLVESNTGFPGIVVPFDIPGMTTVSFLPDEFGDAAACSESLAAQEPDTAALSCFCSPLLDPLFKASASDGADFDCQTPGLEVVKTCLEPDTSLGIVPVEIHVTNTGTADLANCVVSDSIYLDDNICPADVGAGTPVAVSPEVIVDLPVGGSSVLVTGDTACPAANEACNEASVTCEIVGSTAPGGGPKTVTVTADDLCLPCGGGCLTRTPGFWGTHPHVAEKFLPLNSCGIEINNTFAWTDGSTAEDMCSSGRDFKAADTSPQQLQLIRQCMAANLNIAATLDGSGSCEADYPNINGIIDSCCNTICSSGASNTEINNSGCIGLLDTFNNLPDTLDPYGAFIRPGPAQPGECREANGNGFVNPGRYLGPRN